MHLHCYFSPTIPVLGCLHIFGRYEGALQEAHSALTAEHTLHAPRGRAGTSCKAGPQNDLLLQDTSWEGHHNNPESCHVDPASQLPDFSHTINNKPQCYCHYLPYQPCNLAQAHQREANEEAFYFIVQITNPKRSWISWQLHVAQISVPLQNAIHIT